MRAVDRAGNQGSTANQVKLFRAENPFLRDGDPSWLSIDTRVFRMFAGEARFDGVTLDDGVFCGPSCVFTNVVNPRAEVPALLDGDFSLIDGCTAGCRIHPLGGRELAGSD